MEFNSHLVIFNSIFIQQLRSLQLRNFHILLFNPWSENGQNFTYEYVFP